MAVTPKKKPTSQKKTAKHPVDWYLAMRQYSVRVEYGMCKTVPHYAGLVSGALLLILMTLTFIDVIGRYVFSAPIKAIFELTEMSQTLFIITGVWIVTLTGSHIKVDLFNRFLPLQFQLWWKRIIWALFIISFFAVGQRIWHFAERSVRREAVSEYFKIPIFYVQGYTAIICIAISVSLTIFLVLHIIYPNLFADETAEGGTINQDN